MKAIIKKPIFLVTTFLLLVSPCSTFAQLSSTQIDSLMLTAMQKFNVAGAAVAVVKDGQVVHKKGYGVKWVQTASPVDTFTNFQIASNSKAFTTAALAILIDEGKLSWKDKVKKYIPEFKMYNDYVTENFMIEDLLCHRSGLGLGVGDLMFFPDGSNFTMQDILSSFQYFKPTSAFRTQFDYDNLLYFVAGEVIARVSGMSWEQFVTTKILQPLQMNHSYTSFAEMKDKSNLAHPHSTLNPDGTTKSISWFTDMISGAPGGILSNVDDMSKWVIAQLNKGKYGAKSDKQLFSPVRQKEMWTIHTVTPANAWRYNTHFSGYGLGWFLQDLKGNMNVSHTGGLPGMLSKVNMIPDLNLGIIILTNTESGGAALFSVVNNTIVDSYLGLEKMDWTKLYADRLQTGEATADSVTQKVWATVDAARKTKIDGSNFIGIYQDNWFGKVEIFMKGDQLWFRSYRSPRLNGAMYFYKANTFAIKWEYRDMPCDAFALFTLDEEGKAQGIKMKAISPITDFSFDFHDLDFHRLEK